MTEINISLPKKIRKALEHKALNDKISQEAVIVKLLEKQFSSFQNIKQAKIDEGLQKFEIFLNKIPSVNVISSGSLNDCNWWIEFNINISHKLAWHVVQELGFVLNHISINDRLPTLFMPISPPPYLNGGPSEYLSWLIESREAIVDPYQIVLILIGRLPNPIDDLNQWIIEDE